MIATISTYLGAWAAAVYCAAMFLELTNAPRWALLVFAPLIGVVMGAFARSALAQGPSTASWAVMRAVRHRRREVQSRSALFIRAGLSPEDAEKKAEGELEHEAKEVLA